MSSTRKASFIRNSVFLVGLLSLVTACSDMTGDADTTDADCRQVIQAGNITYSFPQGTDLALRTALVGKCQRSIRENLALISETDFTDTFDLEFLSSRREILKYAGFPATGVALPERDVMFCILDRDFERNSPIQHELMHMLAMYKWGHPPASSTWMNEGLATWSSGTGAVCAGYSYEQIYAYLLLNNKRMPIEGLSGDFYGQPEMIAYTQCAYLAGSLLAEHGVDKFRRLWKEGIDRFEAVYGMPYHQWQDALDLKVRAKYPGMIELDWERLQKGC